MSGRFLLDVNVLISLFDPAHLHHAESHSWWAGIRKAKWATCPITINGCIRILSNPRHPSVAATGSDVASALREMCNRLNHEFWADEISLLDEEIFDWKWISGPGQLTDVYLLALAVSHGGRLVTLDRSIPWKAVKTATAANLELLGGPRL